MLEPLNAQSGPNAGSPGSVTRLAAISCCTSRVPSFRTVPKSSCRVGRGGRSQPHESSPPRSPWPVGVTLPLSGILRAQRIRAVRNARNSVHVRENPVGLSGNCDTVSACNDSCFQGEAPIMPTFEDSGAATCPSDGSSGDSICIAVTGGSSLVPIFPHPASANATCPAAGCANWPRAFEECVAQCVPENRPTDRCRPGRTWAASAIRADWASSEFEGGHPDQCRGSSVSTCTKPR